MSDKKMIMFYKIIRIPYSIGQLILLIASAYLLATNNENWPWPILLLSLQQITYWVGYIYYSKKMNGRNEVEQEEHVCLVYENDRMLIIISKRKIIIVQLNDVHSYIELYQKIFR